MVVRLLAGLLPFLLAAGLVYWTLLRPHDINYYLARRPAGVLGRRWRSPALLAVALVLLLVRTIARWALALPLVLFENVARAGRSARAPGDRSGTGSSS